MASVTLHSARRAAGLTQEALADRLGVDRGTVGRWERGLQTPHPWQRPALGDALGLLPADLDDLLSHARPTGEPELSESGRPDQMASPDSEDGRSPTQTELATKDIVRASMPRLRRALDMLDLPDDGPVRPARDLARDVIRLNEHRLDARYVDIVRAAPPLISELARASQQATDEERRLAAQLMTLALRAADGVAFKFGYLDLSARLIDLMRVTALAAEDPALLAAVAYVRTETYLATGDLDTALRALASAIDRASRVQQQIRQLRE